MHSNKRPLEAYLEALTAQLTTLEGVKSVALYNGQPGDAAADQLARPAVYVEAYPEYRDGFGRKRDIELTLTLYIETQSYAALSAAPAGQVARVAEIGLSEGIATAMNGWKPAATKASKLTFLALQPDVNHDSTSVVKAEFRATLYDC